MRRSAAGSVWPRLVRGIDSGTYLESFLVWAVASTVVTRLYLELTGYPQIGGRGLHIAHMLWGGLLMLAALVLLLAFIGRPVKHTAAIVGGIGFGLFIDELGKFITSDNNYFFQPTFAILYVIFVALFLVFRTLGRSDTLTPEERLVNAADFIKEALLGRATRAEAARAIALIDASGRRSPVAEAIVAALRTASYAPERPPALPVRLLEAARERYVTFVCWRWFRLALVGLFGLQAFVFLALYSVAFVVGPRQVFDDVDRSFPDLMVFICSTVSAVLAAAGVVRLRWSRIGGYRLFRLSMLVSIFFTQVFAFVNAQLAGLIDLGIDIALLGALNFMIAEERSLPHTSPERSAVVTPAAAPATRVEV